MLSQLYQWLQFDQYFLPNKLFASRCTRRRIYATIGRIIDVPMFDIPTKRSCLLTSQLDNFKQVPTNNHLLVDNFKKWHCTLRQAHLRLVLISNAESQSTTKVRCTWHSAGDSFLYKHLPHCILSNTNIEKWPAARSKSHAVVSLLRAVVLL